MEKTKEIKKREEGITLIALVVTIIVLLILAGIAISLTIGNNGLFKKAENAAEKWKEAEVKEKDEMQNFVELYDKTQKGVVEEKEIVSEEESYVGYYADVNGDGDVDGVIYADLAKGGSGQWSNINGDYEIPVEENVKKYYISKKGYTGAFGTKDVLRATGSGKDRFYVMSLKDLEKDGANIFCWYDDAYGKMTDYNEATSLAFGSGKSNTTAMISKWEAEGYGKQDQGESYKDIWGQIKEEVNSGWFVPSKGEWSAFGDELNILGNYRNYGLSVRYWSSSQHLKTQVWHISVSSAMYASWVYSGSNVRMSTTF